MAQVTEQAEAGHIGRRMRARGERGVLGRFVQRRHELRDLAQLACRDPSLFDRLRGDAEADRFAEYEPVAGARVRVRERRSGVYGPDDAQAVLELGVLDGMAADDCAPRLCGLV